MTTPGKTPGEPGTRRQADGPHVQRLAEENQRLAEENWRELRDDPYDLLFPDECEPWRVGRAEYVIVVDQGPRLEPGRTTVTRRAPGNRTHRRTGTRPGSRTMTRTRK